LYKTLTYSTPSQLSAHHQTVLESPVVIADCAPLVVVAHLDTPTMWSLIPVVVQSDSTSLTNYKVKQLIISHFYICHDKSYMSGFK